MCISFPVSRAGECSRIVRIPRSRLSTIRLASRTIELDFSSLSAAMTQMLIMPCSAMPNRLRNRRAERPALRLSDGLHQQFVAWLGVLFKINQPLLVVGTEIQGIEQARERFVFLAEVQMSPDELDQLLVRLARLEQPAAGVRETDP